RNRLVRHPRKPIVNVYDDVEWFELALESDLRVPFQAVVVGDALRSPRLELGGTIVDIADALDSTVWAPYRVSRKLGRTPGAYRDALTPVLRHAKKVQLVDQHFLPYEPRCLNT